MFADPQNVSDASLCVYEVIYHTRRALQMSFLVVVSLIPGPVQ